MSEERFEEAGQVWITVEAVARCYEVEVEVLHIACHEGLLLHVEHSGVLAVPVLELDRVAVLVRMHVYQGVPLESVALFLDVARS